ncbi:TetR/AcrR family transcriptional regulator C-terminal domain-containing protein [Nonomuraea sp. CA-218870]|uniref:TetR/AcrR family transcriptional regulator C-terminal domain-containing protein n=1 Tax=Nonomuraea sp. CA-218870 TaxID=3239998 RepID=UPI003D8E464E
MLREAVSASADQALVDNLAAVDRLTDCGTDLRATLEDVGLRLLQCYCDDRSWALRRLLSAEINQFPDLLDIHTRAVDRITETLADRLARLTVAGCLHTPDPVLAAEQFFALLCGPMDKRARLGTRGVADTERRALSCAAVHTFLQAFASAPTEIT